MQSAPDDADLNSCYIFYDGDCGFCNFWVQWILKRDTRDRFLFSSLQSDFGQKFLKDRGLPPDQFSTLFLWRPRKYYLTKAAAVFEICSVLGGRFRLLSYLRYLPAFLTNSLYDLIARQRHRFVSAQCMLPTPEQREKFIS